MSYAMSVVDMSLPLLDDGQEMLKIGRRTLPFRPGDARRC